jgi:hypothetical protein
VLDIVQFRLSKRLIPLKEKIATRISPALAPGRIGTHREEFLESTRRFSDNN